MSVDDCLENLSKMTAEAFRKSRILGMRGKTKQEQRAHILQRWLTNLVAELVRERTKDYEEPAQVLQKGSAKLPLESPDGTCQT